jgi:hypothetical protein
MRLKSFEDFLNEKSNCVINSPAFSIREKNPGEIIDVECTPVIIKEFTSWTKNKQADCITFVGELEDGTEVNVKYDEGVDGYVFYEPKKLLY